MTTTGVIFRPQSPPEDLREVVELADAAGVAELWLWEDCFLEGGLTSAALALAWSSRVRVAVGLLPVPLRNPALAAMEIATLARVFPDRFTVALGHGVQEWMAQVGAAVESPMTLLREHVAAVRALLAGETVDTAGRYVGLDRVALDWPPRRPPRLLLGGRGARTIRLAGETSDGVVLDSVVDPDVVRRARDLVGAEALVYAYTEVDPRSGLDHVPAWVEELGAAGADGVVLQAPEDAPDTRPLIEALARH